MAIMDIIHGRQDGKNVQNLAQDDVAVITDSDANSLEARNEKEIQEHPTEITANALPGQQKAEAAALVWPKSVVYATYAWIWICFFMLALQSSIGNNVIYNAYSSFNAAPQVSTAGVCASIVGGVLKLVIAKVLNIWGRAEGFLFFVLVYIIGIVVIATCKGPNAYAAGYTLYWVGYDAIYLILDVFVADTSGLRNRAFAFAFVSTPFICTAFTGPLAATSFLDNGGGWRWAWGAFAIIMPVVFVPLAIVFKFYQLKAEKMGIFVRNPSGRTTMQSIVHYVHEFDVVGALILMAAFLLVLLPFSLEGYAFTTFGSAEFIAMIVIGFLLFPVFAVWEKWFTRIHFVRWELFRQRTVLGACILAMLLNFSFYSWDLYYYYFILVVYNLNTTYTGYMTQIYNVGSCFWGVVFGIYVRTTKHFKYACLCFGLPLMMLGAGLMIHFRGQEGSLGYIVMCQIFIAFGGGTLVIGEQMAVMAAADRDGVPMMLCIISLFGSIGSAIGDAVSAAIYQHTFPGALESALPAAEKFNATTIYLGGYLTQIEYAVGTPTRDAINYAWGYSQRMGAISACSILVLGFPAIAVWKNYNVNRAQNKGTVI
ncbi:putative siderochrome-iron transporter [Mollisia scopiformis]|uniref:Putative siderochrome-iron transporter n=1 Tax=Mollisia scopiformis TaxID=149040 RepID=A0A132BCQ5_MOLSC|nr:putative siderochrome-iron transporter [Mollisia scopiformis]KUJ10212.1 putative siderochrome-iron transporter [Mollisia scopiformis]